jgi:hypothetical protein
MKKEANPKCKGHRK